MGPSVLLRTPSNLPPGRRWGQSPAVKSWAISSAAGRCPREVSMKTVAKTPAPFRKALLLALFAACLLLLCVLLLVAAGVRSRPTVTGIVRLDGQPVAAGWIKFVPLGSTPGPDAGAA